MGLEESTIAEVLYASPAHLDTMVRHGMQVGAHGVSRPWLSTATLEAMLRSIACPLDFLARIGANTVGWTMAYPYGDHEDETWRC